MAVMATPEPTSAAFEQKAPEMGPESQRKLDMNGHSSPKPVLAESQLLPEVTINGDNKQHQSGSQGSSRAEVELQEDPNKQAFAANQNIPKDFTEPAPAEPTPPAALPESLPVVGDTSEPNAVELTSNPTSDINMVDAEEIGQQATASTVGEEPTGEPTGEPAEEPTPVESAQVLEPIRSAEDVKDSTETQVDEVPSETPQVNEAAADAHVQSPPAEQLPPPIAPQEVDLGPVSISQLDIGTGDENNTQLPGVESADVPMSDAPAPAKVSRERDEDPSDEPIAKRAKTDPQEPEHAVTADVDADGPSEVKGLETLNQLHRWNDPELENQPISPYQAREYRKILAGIKKTKIGFSFKDAVAKLWPHLQDAYEMLVSTPMDIGKLERQLKDESYSTLGEFKRDLALLFLNACAFNGEGHEVSQQGLGVVSSIWTKCITIPADEPPKSKAPPKQLPSRHHEQRTSQSRAQAQPPSQAPSPPKSKTDLPPVRRASSGATSPTDRVAESQTYAVPPNGVPQIRRASTQNDGDRPKRTIHPPKSKDIEYVSKGLKKKDLKPELQFCEEVLSELRDEKHSPANLPFLAPVDPVALSIPTYFRVVKKPMDLSTMYNKLFAGEYATAKQFQGDMDLMLKNCFLFNDSGTPVYQQGKQLEKAFKAEWAKKDQWIAKNAPSKAASNSASDHGSEDESEYEDEARAPSESTATNESILLLQERLQEETTKLNKMFLDSNPQEAMIKIQQEVVRTVQNILLAEKQKLATQKPEKPTKTKSKPAKPKASGAGGQGKKAGGATAATKKSGGTKKVTKTNRIITEAEKAAIANAINDLDMPHIEHAIGIIKKDTNQTENNNGELELDIDQLSNDALCKLFDLLRRVLPHFPSRDKPDPASSPVVNSGTTAKQVNKSARPKKNKPMSATEQEERIAKLSRVRDQYRSAGGQAGTSPEAMDTVVAHGLADDSDEESDSEEE